MADVATLTTIVSSHQIYLERLSATYSNALQPRLDNIASRASALLDKLPNRTLSAAEQKAFRESFNAIVKEELKDWTAYLGAEHRDLGLSEAQFINNAVTGVMISDVATVIPTISAVNSAAKSTPIKMGEGKYTTYNAMLTNFTNSYTADADMIIRNGFASGQPPQAMAAQIRDELLLTGARAMTSAKMIARTGTNHYSTQARLQYGRDNDDIIIGYRSIATLDSYTSKQCKYWDQKVRKESDSDWSSFVLPRHPNERSALSMEIDGRYRYDDSASQRPSNFEVDGDKDPKRVSSKDTYYDQLSLLDEDDQDVALASPTLGAAFRRMTKGGDRALFERQVLDSLYQPLTIAEMKESNNELGRILRDMEKSSNN